MDKREEIREMETSRSMWVHYANIQEQHSSSLNNGFGISGRGHRNDILIPH